MVNTAINSTLPKLAGLVMGLALSSGSQSLSSSAPVTERAQPVRSCAASLGQLQPLRGAELDTSLEFLSWNIQKSSNAGWAEDLASFAEGVHLAFIQEASRQSGIESILPTPLHPFFARGYTRGELETGVMTLSSGFPSLRCSLSAREPWLGTPKATGVTEYPLRGRDDRLLAINLHAVNFTFGVEDLRVQFEALSELLEKHRGPVILAGDFNTWSASREVLVHQFLRGFDLAPVEFGEDLRTTAFGRALDHIYVRGMASDSARVIPVQSSDHNPLRVRLTIN